MTVTTRSQRKNVSSSIVKKRCSSKSHSVLKTRGLHSSGYTTYPKLRSNELAICSPDDVTLKGYNTYWFSGFSVLKDLDGDDILELNLKSMCKCGERTVRILDPYLFSDFPNFNNVMDGMGHYNELELECMLEEFTFNEYNYLVVKIDSRGHVDSLRRMSFM